MGPKAVKISTALRIATRVGPKDRYYGLLRQAGRLSRMRGAGKGDFRRHVRRDLSRFLVGRVRPVRGENSRRLAAAAEWLLRAQAASPDDGVSFGYFPSHKDAVDGWLPSYPETTGYIIPTLLEFARLHGRPEVRDRALAMARWEVDVQMPSGAAQGGFLCAPQKRVAAVFNTGMVLHGLTAALRVGGEGIFEAAGRKAADFLLADLGPDGHFRSHGRFVVQDAIKTYNCLCGWALWMFGETTGEARYRDAAVRVAEAAVGEQRPNGWFANNCLISPDSPLTHTIGYTLQGVLEVGLLAGRENLVQAARRGVDALVERIAPSGFLAACFFSDWEPAATYSCLTGNAQLAVVCYRLHEVTGSGSYREAADRLLDWLKALQSLDPAVPGAQGALGGSFPLLAAYQSAGYPNWATKYLLDGLMVQDRLGAEGPA
jgi:hypothetical protein